jgi:hypothetical protein
MTRTWTRQAAVLLLMLLIYVLPVSAAAPFTLDGQAPSSGLSLPWRGMVSDLWNRSLRLWEKEGSSLDPNGKPGPNPPGSSPNGLTGKEGSSIDPHGKLRPKPARVSLGGFSGSPKLRR